jgi:hypothetical protein
LHALTGPYEEIREANTARIQAEQRLKQLTDHQQDGGSSLSDDDPRVIAAQKHLDKMTAEYKRLTARNDARAAAFTTAKQTATAVETWLRDSRPSGTVLQDHEVEPPTLVKGESSILDAIENRRRRVRELRADLKRISDSPFSSAHAKAQMRAQIEALAQRGAPNVADLIEHDRQIEFATTRVQSDVIGAEARGIAFHQATDALAVVAWMFKDALVKRLDAEIDAEADDKAAMSHEARQKAEAEVMGDLLDIERQEAAFVWQAMAQGLPVFHRKDCSPFAILQLRLVTAPRTNVPDTSPGMSWLRR